jgi:hypothetical protein
MTESTHFEYRIRRSDRLEICKRCTLVDRNVGTASRNFLNIATQNRGALVDRDFDKLACLSATSAYHDVAFSGADVANPIAFLAQH